VAQAGELSNKEHPWTRAPHPGHCR